MTTAMRIALLTLLFFLGLSALAGSFALLTDPSGAIMGATPELLRRTPFTDFFWPGVILGAVFGVGSLATFILLLRGWNGALRAAQVIGAGQLIWISVQLLTLPAVSWLQVIYFATGLAMVVIAGRCRRAIPA